MIGKLFQYSVFLQKVRLCCGKISFPAHLLSKYFMNKKVDKMRKQLLT